MTKEQLWEELRNFVAFFTSRDVEECLVLFGFAWGIEYYPDKDWEAETILLKELESRILQLEKRGLGEFGYNDVFVELDEIEFRFCNDTDIHIGFDSHQPFIEDFYSRWETLNYYPAEWIKNQKHGSGELVRGGK